MIELAMTMLLVAPQVFGQIEGHRQVAEVTPAAAIRIWDGPAPNARGDDPKDVPTLTPYPAQNSPAGEPVAALVICPGGGYRRLAEHEGAAYAQWLSNLGIAAFVLKYRLGSDGYRHPTMLLDLARAVRVVRAQHERWNVDPGRIGVIGSSAGGHLASTLLTHFDAGRADSTDQVERVSSRPDLGILCYPVISLGTEFGHRGSADNLLGEDPDPALIASLSNELQVTAETPPCFLWHTSDDAVVSVRNSYAFAAALAEHGVPHELHVYGSGTHGLGLGIANPIGQPMLTLHAWTRACHAFLTNRGYIAPPPAFIIPRDGDRGR